MGDFKLLRGVELKRFVRKSKLERSSTIDIILLNLSYATNVASVFRSADAFGIDTVHLIGCSPMPPFSKKLQNVSRGKENSVQWRYSDDFPNLAAKLKEEGYRICALELAMNAKPLSELQVGENEKIALIVGNEEHGVPTKHLKLVDECYYIPMNGKGKSLNVATTAVLGMYQSNSRCKSQNAK